MRILQLHSNFIVFKPVQKEIAIAEEAEQKENRIEEVVVLFTAIEEGDNTADWRRKPLMTSEPFWVNRKLTAY